MRPDKKLTFHTPAAYRIRVQGHLDDSWSDQLGGLTVTAVQLQDGTSVTTLVGALKDQAALAGVLATLSDLGLPLLSVDHVADSAQE
jgi:hypothetical protein